MSPCRDVSSRLLKYSSAQRGPLPSRAIFRFSFCILKGDKRLVSLVKQNQQMQALQAIPGIGPLTATVLVATATDLSSFDSGRQFAAWLGLTPRQTGTGGKTRQLGIPNGEILMCAPC